MKNIIMKSTQLSKNKKMVLFFTMMTSMIALFMITAIIQTMPVKAGSAQKGIITPGCTAVRIRKTTDTSSTANVITKVDGGFQMDILDTVNTSETYAWYYVGFNLNSSYTYGYVYSEFVTLLNSEETPGYDKDQDFETYLNEQKFPEDYKADLRKLHEQYPNWIFVSDHNGTDWNEMVKNQNVLGRSLIYNYAKSSWKSTADGAYDWNTGKWIELDSGGWVQASSELVQYALDPRNFMNDVNIFMFESLSYNNAVHTTNGVNNVISGSFMDGSGHNLNHDGTNYNYASGLMLAGSISGVSPYHLATRIIQEQGRAGSGQSISGSVSGYSGLYNYYNQGAYKTASASAVVNGLIYASKTDAATLRPWNTRMKSIIGGAITLGSKYINIGQNTIYYEKFDVDTYWHQYMTNILAARSESTISSSAYSSTMKKNNALVFRIPVYDNMPGSVCKIPDGDGSPNNTLTALSVEGYSLTPSFSKFTDNYDLIVNNNVTSVNITASAADSSAKIDGTGRYSLKVGTNTIKVTVNAGNGNNKVYTINIVRKEAANGGGNTGNNNAGYATDYTINKDTNKISGIGVGSNAQDVLAGISFTGGAYGKVTSSDGNDKSGVVSTGDKITIYNGSGSQIAQFDVVIYGDNNGDGEIDLLDIVRIKRYMLEMMNLNGANYSAADVNKDGQIDLLDIIAIKRHMLGKEYIAQ